MQCTLVINSRKLDSGVDLTVATIVVVLLRVSRFHDYQRFSIPWLYDWVIAHSTTLFGWSAYIVLQRLAQLVCAPPRSGRCFLELHALSDAAILSMTLY